MPYRTRILRHVRSNLVAYVALFFALTGSAYAAGGLLVYSENIVDGQVLSADVADNNLTGVDVANGTVSGFDVADSSLWGDDIANGSLSGADVADNSLTGTDVAENTLSVAGMGCQSGKVLGFARVKGRALSRDFVLGHTRYWVSDPKYIDITHNCAGGDVQVYSYEPGEYLVKFVGNPAALAVATATADESILGTDIDNILTVSKEYTDNHGWFFHVRVRDVCGQGDDSSACNNAGVRPQSGDFTIVLP